MGYGGNVLGSKERPTFPETFPFFIYHLGKSTVRRVMSHYEPYGMAPCYCYRRALEVVSLSYIPTVTTSGSFRTEYNIAVWLVNMVI